MPAYKKKITVKDRTASEIYKIIAGDIENFLKKMGLSDFKITKIASKKQIELESKMFSAVLTAKDGEIHLDGKLSLLAMPFQSKIDEGIDRWIQKNLKA
jgi:hypothetical protein